MAKMVLYSVGGARDRKCSSAKIRFCACSSGQICSRDAGNEVCFKGLMSESVGNTSSKIRICSILTRDRNLYPLTKLPCTPINLPSASFFSAPKSQIRCRFVMSAELQGIWNWELDAAGMLN